MIIVVSGPGGVGKGTIVERMIERDEALWLSRSWTTRERRPGEDPNAYRFVDRATFDLHIERGGFLEWVEFQGNRMGTPWPEVPEQSDLLLEIDVQGAQLVRAQDAEALLVFVDAPSREAQANRLRARGDDPAAVVRRVAAAEGELDLAHDLGAVVVINDDLEAAVDEILTLVRLARASQER